MADAARWYGCSWGSWQFDLNSITDKLADMEGEDEVPKIKLGDAACAAPFTSKLSNVSASACRTPTLVSEFCADVPAQLRTSSGRVAARSWQRSRCTRFWR